MKPKQIKFNLYRYQLLPLTRTIQGNIFDTLFPTIEVLVEKKNEFFFDVLKSDTVRFHEDREKVRHLVEYSDGTSMLMKMNVKKKTLLQTKDFRVKSEDDYPKVLIYFNNDKNHQIIAIQSNSKAFSSPDVLSKVIEKSLDSFLMKYNLGIYVEPLFDENDFWQILKKNEKKITYLKFELIKPNISNISGKIKETFNLINTDTNSHVTEVVLHAPKQQVLENLNRDNEALKAIADYNLKGGGKPPVYKIGNVKKIHKTFLSEKSIEISDIVLNGPHETIVKIFKNLTKL